MNKAKKKVKSKPELDSKLKSKKKDVKLSKKALTNQPIIEIKRHWYGLISLYFLMGFGILIVVLFFSFIDISLPDKSILLFTAVLFLTAITYVLAVFIAKIYNGNILTVSPIEVRQLTREALFFTKSSVLGLANVEDVTIVRNGLFAHAFDYGTLNIETAGEQENFMFKYCPKPEECARTLMSLREEYLKATKQDQVLR